MPKVIQPRLEWHIATLEATPERARSIVQNETLEMLRELKAARDVGGAMLFELHHHMGCDERCESTYHPYFFAANSPT